MKALVVYHTEFGNTRQVAEAIAEAFGQACSARAVVAEHLDESDLQGIDLLVMGTPTHKMGVPQAVRPVLEALPRGSLQGVAVAAFDTSYKMSGFLARFTAAQRLERQLRKLGGRRLVPPETFHVHHSHEGPLFEGETERARRWAGSLLARIEGGS